MTVLVTLSIAGTDTGPFNLYSNADGYLSAFETNITRSQLLIGYVTESVPDTTITIRAKSFGPCSNHIDIPTGITTTTTSSTLLCNSYLYNVTLYNCGTCAETGGGSISNDVPLVVGKYYYNIGLGFKMRIDSYNSCNSSMSTHNVNLSSQQDTCAAVVCPS